MPGGARGKLAGEHPWRGGGGGGGGEWLCVHVAREIRRGDQKECAFLLCCCWVFVCFFFLSLLVWAF